MFKSSPQTIPFITQPNTNMIKMCFPHCELCSTRSPHQINTHCASEKAHRAIVEILSTSSHFFLKNPKVNNNPSFKKLLDSGNQVLNLYFDLATIYIKKRITVKTCDLLFRSVLETSDCLEAYISLTITVGFTCFALEYTTETLNWIHDIDPDILQFAKMVVKNNYPLDTLLTRRRLPFSLLNKTNQTISVNKRMIIYPVHNPGIDLLRLRIDSYLLKNNSHRITHWDSTSQDPIYLKKPLIIFYNY